jgi:IS5 family transposase
LRDDQWERIKDFLPGREGHVGGNAADYRLFVNAVLYSAYRSAQIEADLKAKGLHSRIHRRAARNRPLSERQKSANTARSKVRARVEHVFDHQENSMGGKIVRTIRIVRARFKIGMMNLGYNIRRLVRLKRMAAAPA